MSATERLGYRNDLITALREVDAKLAILFGEKFSNRVYAECKELLEIRADLAFELVKVGGEPDPDPVDFHQHETRVVL